MNGAHLHLILNHLPIIALPIVLVFLAYSIWQKQIAIQKFSYLMLVMIAFVASAVFLSGEPAEHVVEGLAGVTTPSIESHESAAIVSLVLIILTGVFALLSWLALIKNKEFWLVKQALWAFALAATFSLLYTAMLGGQIRHTEIHSAPSSLEIPESGKGEK